MRSPLANRRLKSLPQTGKVVPERNLKKWMLEGLYHSDKCGMKLHWGPLDFIYVGICVHPFEGDLLTIHSQCYAPLEHSPVTHLNLTPKMVVSSWSAGKVMFQTVQVYLFGCLVEGGTKKHQPVGSQQPRSLCSQRFGCVLKRRCVTGGLGMRRTVHLLRFWKLHIVLHEIWCKRSFITSNTLSANHSEGCDVACKLCALRSLQKPPYALWTPY